MQRDNHPPEQRKLMTSAFLFVVLGFSGPSTAPISFNASFGSSMVLQRAPSAACVYGILGEGGSAASIKISSSDSSFVSYTVDAAIDGDGGWKACLKPHTTGGNFTLTATCTGCTNSTPATLRDVTFGDVWFCGGQSNMALPLVHTLTRNTSRDAILAGKYGNLRIHGISGNMNPTQPWTTLRDALATDAADPDNSMMMQFSSTCYYFGESLSDELAKSSADGAAPPIGLINTAFGGSTIEQWLDASTMATCANASADPSDGEWHVQRVLPYVHTTLKGWVWYQGENDMHGVFGNSARKVGYACMMPALVASWRSMWAAASGTDALAPFGLVTLAPSGTEGGSDIGTMRWAQTASYGVLPNPAMPHTFLAQAFDLNDPWSNISCYHAVGCPTKPPPPGGYGSCEGYCKSLEGTNYYMGPVHPRDKRPVGQRLAQAAAVVAYGHAGAATGPTLSGCRKSATSITLSFNASLLAAGGDKLVVQPYNRATGASKLQVLINASLFCLQSLDNGATCIDDGEGGHAALPGGGGGGGGGGASFEDEGAWVAVDVAVSASSPNALEVDLTRSGGVAYAVRYGWEGDCCSENPPTSDACPLASCPLMASASKLPANPFVAKISDDGRCECIAPQVCDE